MDNRGFLEVHVWICYWFSERVNRGISIVLPWADSRRHLVQLRRRPTAPTWTKTVSWLPRCHSTSPTTTRPCAFGCWTRPCPGEGLGRSPGRGATWPAPAPLHSRSSGSTGTAARSAHNKNTKTLRHFRARRCDKLTDKAQTRSFDFEGGYSLGGAYVSRCERCPPSHEPRASTLSRHEVISRAIV